MDDALRSMWDTMMALHAHDGGAIDSGLRDEVARRRIREQLGRMGQDEFRLFIARGIRETFLDEDALAAGYGVRDVLGFARWMADEMDCDPG